MEENNPNTPSLVEKVHAQEEADATNIDRYHQRMARKLGRKILRNVAKGKPVTVVRRGPLDVFKPKLTADAYARVQQYLTPHQMEISAHEYASGVDGGAVTHTVVVERQRGQNVIKPPRTISTVSAAELSHIQKIYPPSK